jgi:hypothetical protein
MYGHTGRLLIVDLTIQTTTITAIDPDLMEQFGNKRRPGRLHHA